MSRWLVLSAVLVLASTTRASDRGIAGTQLVIRAHGSSKKVAFVSKDPAVPFPAIGGPDDPASGTPGGATIEVVTPGGVATLAVPIGSGWSEKDGKLDSYTFKNTLAPGGPSPLRSVSLHQGRVLKFTARDLSTALGTPLGSVGIRITMGATRACALFTGASVAKDVPGAFVGRHAAATANDCSNAALGVVPACGNGSLDAGEQCDGTSFGTTTVACTYEPGLAVPACTASCTCCATLACSAELFDAPCCPGYVCPQRFGPHSISYCRKACEAAGDCNAGDLCIGGECRTPNCTTSTDCGAGGICVPGPGVCCYDVPGLGIACP